MAVVGGGVIGLTTALQLQRELHNAEITVYACDFDTTVSHVAAGIFRVGSSYCGPSEQITRKWIKNSYEYYDDIRKSSETAAAGVTSISGYMFANSSPWIVKNAWMEDLVPIYRRATDAEFELIGGNWKYGSFFTTLLTDCNFYLPWARQKLQETGAVLVKREIDSLKELIGQHDLIMNCTGLGARRLCNDRRMVSIRGQVYKVKAPWIKTFFYGELDTYVIPGVNETITLGGCRDFDSENSDWCEFQGSVIRKRCEALVPALKGAEIAEKKVGFRPHREGSVRVEAERITDGTSKAILVHNYGHGGYGVCTAPGTGEHAVALAKQMHLSSSVSKL